MYKIIGADGKEYGPVNAEQLRQWLTEGRVNQQTRVLAEGNTEWKTFGEVAELSPSTTPQAVSSLRNSDQSSARDMVRGPAIFILVLSILNIPYCILMYAFQDQILGLSTMPEQSAALQKNIAKFFSLPANIFGVLLSVACLIGALKMMKLQSHSFAIATAIMMLIPCSKFCCFLNIGAGIWALVVLQKPEVKSAFE